MTDVTPEDGIALAITIRDTMLRQEWLPASLGIQAADALTRLAAQLSEARATERREYRVAYRNGMEPGGTLPYRPGLDGCYEGAYVESRTVFASEWREEA